MTKDDLLFTRHIQDLANAAYRKHMPVSTDFLNLYEQDLFLCMKEKLPPVYYELNGGTSFNERKMVLFMPDKDSFGDFFPISILEITPVQQKFSDELNHRDYLGALMNLGIERSVLGDIFLSDSFKTYVFCKQSMADYIEENLSFVKHTHVKVSPFLGELSMLSPRMEEVKGSVATPRLDSVLALAFQGSRSKLSGLIEGKKVFVNSRLIESSSYMLKNEDIVSVRGYGKFVYKETTGITKKGRSYIILHKYS